ncbi:hypothetical protein KP509_23G028600 [Ceratopteris richardii]|uniref:Uncharacterized protein n=1 Tax=Ceratopteris richardii TaxID=49495 RepID=A0A8T2S1F5_CERRI|nr:hypothetical protein KP509_23G028600 [Ceratopteris richardii]KAH7301472.1 hypothetical protein KP509_23G028600 [Ceratopteris richardii]KAH7301473.1 hypothetical protein KP509_23G028600 [Ceratopteris richardii]
MAASRVSSYSLESQRVSLARGSSALISPEGVREDGRSPHECRPAFLQTGAVNAAAGSAYAEFGQTKVIVSVFGPRESKKAQAYSDIGRLNCNVSFATFAGSVRGKAGQSTEEKEYSQMLYKGLEGAVALHTFPKTTVDVFALILQSGGGDLPVVLSCASLALADAGIVMYDLVSAISLSRLDTNLLLDATLGEEINQDGSLMLACMASRNEVTQLLLTGEWSQANLSEGLKLCLDACTKLAGLMRSTLKESTSNIED